MVPHGIVAKRVGAPKERDPVVYEVKDGRQVLKQEGKFGYVFRNDDTLPGEKDWQRAVAIEKEEFLLVNNSQTNVASFLTAKLTTTKTSTNPLVKAIEKHLSLLEELPNCLRHARLLPQLHRKPYLGDAAPFAHMTTLAYRFLLVGRKDLHNVVRGRLANDAPGLRHANDAQTGFRHAYLTFSEDGSSDSYIFKIGSTDIYVELFQAEMCSLLANVYWSDAPEAHEKVECHCGARVIEAAKARCRGKKWEELVVMPATIFPPAEWYPGKTWTVTCEPLSKLDTLDETTRLPVAVGKLPYVTGGALPVPQQQVSAALPAAPMPPTIATPPRAKRTRDDDSDASAPAPKRARLFTAPPAVAPLPDKPDKRTLLDTALDRALDEPAVRPTPQEIAAARQSLSWASPASAVIPAYREVRKALEAKDKLTALKKQQQMPTRAKFDEICGDLGWAAHGLRILDALDERGGDDRELGWITKALEKAQETVVEKNFNPRDLAIHMARVQKDFKCALCTADVLAGLVDNACVKYCPWHCMSTQVQDAALFEHFYSTSLDRSQPLVDIISAWINGTGCKHTHDYPKQDADTSDAMNTELTSEKQHPPIASLSLMDDYDDTTHGMGSFHDI